MIDTPYAGLSDDELFDLLDELKKRLARANEFERYNRLNYFEPFDYQRKFMNAGSQFKVRYLRAGNRKQA